MARQATRAREKKEQTNLHKHSFPLVHPHLLARTSDLVSNGHERLETARCDLCSKYFRFSFGFNRTENHTCEQCDWDICSVCFEIENMTPKERRKKERRKKEQKKRSEMGKRLRETEERWKREEEEEELRWNAKKQFASNTIKPSTDNKTLDQKGHKFVVWRSDGYGNDGWHSYNPPPDQHFDTSWKTAKEANERARYLFFWKNPWGIEPEHVNDDNGDPNPAFREGLVTYTVEPADSSRWTVGVVPSAAFLHLPDAKVSRHNLDDEPVKWPSW